MKQLTLISLPVYFENEFSCQQKDLGIEKELTIDDYDVVDVRLFEFPTGYYIRDFHGKPCVTVLVADRDYLTNLSEKEFLTMISEFFSDEDFIEDEEI